MSNYGLGLVLILVSVLLEGSAQLCLKQSTRSGNKLWIGLAIILFVVPIAVYTWALKFLPVSLAFPISSLTFVVVAVLSKYIFGERIRPLRWLGIALILFGVVFITSPL